MEAMSNAQLHWNGSKRGLQNWYWVVISIILPLFPTCSLKRANPLLKASFDIPIITDTVIHLLQNGSEALPADQADKMKMVR